MKEVVVDKQYIKTLSDEEKRAIIFAAEESLYFKNGKIADNSLYANIKRKVVPLLSTNYFTEYLIHIDCFVDEYKNIIIKKSHKIMRIMSLEDNYRFKIPLSVYLTKIPDIIDDKELYKVEYCVINDEDMTEKVKNMDPQEVAAEENQNVENIRFDYSNEFILHKGLNTIELKTETIVPIYDNTYSHNVEIACMKYCVDFNMKTDSYDTIGFGFALDTLGTGERVVKKNKFDNSYRIRFEDWALPGDGCVFVINKK